MAAVQLLLDSAVVLIAAEIGGSPFRRARMPRALGMLVAGIVLGPFTPGYVVDPGGIADLAVPLASVLIPRAEISLIIAQYGVSIGITPDLLAIAMVVMIGTALLPSPLVARWQRRTTPASA